ncbi:DUF2726 domain-containing protein [Ectothiorhodospiraceae bacterium WFHF3C12]|nr:DUF2726 domain-containing protein [Ectothiorhodospiraceae bacterium WFHF3C12]
MDLVIIAIVLGALGLLVALAQQLQKQSKAKLHAKPLLSRPEQVLFHRLREALPEYEVLAQVSFSQFIRAKGDTRKENWRRFAMARQKVADFVICNPDFSVLAVVELDDRSHRRGKDQKRDALLAEAGIPCHRWHVKRMPSGEQIRSVVLPEMTPGGAGVKHEPAPVGTTDSANQVSS